MAGGEAGKRYSGPRALRWFDPVAGRWGFDFAYQAADRKTVLIARVDVTPGKRELMKEWMPADRAGVTGADTAGISDDGKTTWYSYNRVVRDLYMVGGLK